MIKRVSLVVAFAFGKVAMSNSTSYRRVIDHGADVNGFIFDTCLRKVVLIGVIDCTENVSSTALRTNLINVWAVQLIIKRDPNRCIVITFK